MDRSSEMYNFIKKLVTLRREQELWNKPQIQRYSDENFYAFTRDNILALFTNSDTFLNRSITYHSFSEGTKLCNIFDMTGDCIYVTGGKIDITIMGDMKVYIAIS